MDLLKIRLFGNVELCHGTERLPDFPTQKSRALFALLVLRRDRLFSRDRLANDFWADLAEERAKKCLSTDLWRIRIILKRGGFEPDDYIKIHNDGVGFNGSAKYWLDISTFEQHLDTVGRMPPEQIGEKERNCLLASIELYRGDLLDGIYDDWCLVHRESLRAQYLSALELLMRYHMEQQAWELAVGYGQKLVHDDVLLEHIHRTLMRCYYLMGNRPAAIRQYATCTQALRRELGVDPMEETEQVYRTITGVRPLLLGLGQDRPTRHLKPDRPGRKAPLEEVDLALANPYTAQGWLEDASQQLRQGALKGDPPDRSEG